MRIVTEHFFHINFHIKKTLVTLFCAVLLCCSALCALVSTRAEEPLPQQQQGKTYDQPVTMTTNIALQGLDGKTYNLAEMKGSVVLVSFGATWCRPCDAELSALEELKKEYKGKPVKFLWVSVEGHEEISDKDLRAFVKAHKLSFPVLRDPTKLTYTQFSTRVRLPLVLLFDQQGALAAKQFGMSQPENYKTALRARFDKMLAMQAAR